MRTVVIVGKPIHLIQLQRNPSVHVHTCMPLKIGIDRTHLRVNISTEQLQCLAFVELYEYENTCDVWRASHPKHGAFVV